MGQFPTDLNMQMAFVCHYICVPQGTVCYLPCHWEGGGLPIVHVEIWLLLTPPLCYLTCCALLFPSCNLLHPYTEPYQTLQKKNNFRVKRLVPSVNISHERISLVSNHLHFPYMLLIWLNSSQIKGMTVNEQQRWQYAKWVAVKRVAWIMAQGFIG